jgi:asparagine N-glycosylation enzyme membrane subunit Stt3
LPVRLKALSGNLPEFRNKQIIRQMSVSDVLRRIANDNTTRKVTSLGVVAGASTVGASTALGAYALLLISVAAVGFIVMIFLAAVAAIFMPRAHRRRDALRVLRLLCSVLRRSQPPQS